MKKTHFHYSSALLILSLMLLLFAHGCSPSKSKVTVEELSKETIMDGGFGDVPFNKDGQLDFSGRDAQKNMQDAEKVKQEILAKKEKIFDKLARKKFTSNLDNLYWVGPPKHDVLYKAYTYFPRDAYGYPDWVAAAKKGYIVPRGSLYEEEEDEELSSFNLDIIFQINDKMMANVRFPHTVHNYWLSCQVCHPAIFIPKKGANVFGMNDIWGGKFCGKCHGRVAYQPKGFLNCIRCHSVRRKTVKF